MTEPFPIENVFLHYVELQRPAVYAVLFWTYRLFLYTTPLVMLSAIVSIAFTCMASQKVRPLSPVNCRPILTFKSASISLLSSVKFTTNSIENYLHHLTG
jgi:hypothetical protein